jgi:hypothetical protein
VSEQAKDDLAYLARLADWAGGEGFIADEVSRKEGPDEWCSRIYEQWRQDGEEYSPDTLTACILRMAKAATND